ncbi:MAG: hypothetical protein H6742_18375 [Alphaproteobacteria bacterium]|nr:hypothetical protein [Alphaproteobacteria bacterium]
MDCEGNWVLFPLLGVQPEVEVVEVFEDVQLWSKSRVKRQALAGLRGRAEREATEQLALAGRREDRVDSYVAVRCNGDVRYGDVANSRRNPLAFYGPDGHTAWAATRGRADEAAGLLAILALSEVPHLAPALVHHILVEDQWYRAVIDGCQLVMSGHRTHTVRTSALTVDASTLDEWSTRHGVHPLRRALHPAQRRGAQKAIGLALRHFPYALHSEERSVQVVLAHMCLESLLNASKSEKIESRVLGLCGESGVELFELVNRARNQFVHEGKEVHRMTICNAGHLLAASCLVAAAQVVESHAERVKTEGDLAKLAEALGATRHATAWGAASTEVDLPDILNWKQPAAREAVVVRSLSDRWVLVATHRRSDGSAVIVFERSGCYVKLVAQGEVADAAERARRVGSIGRAAEIFSKGLGQRVVPVTDPRSLDVELALAEDETEGAPSSDPR